MRRGGRKELVARLALALFSIAVAVSIFEAAGLFLLSHPSLLKKLPANVVTHLRAYYMSYDRSMIQTIPECTRYDDRLFYTLRPGVCRFANREFANEFHINSAGLRAEEGALRCPETIVLGDSFAMGWGVDGEETFAGLIAAKTHRRVLNAGIASYGTVREVRLLDRLDTRCLTHLIIQYNKSDVLENLEFRQAGNTLAIRPKVVWSADVDHWRTATRYWPGKLTFEIVRHIVAPAPANDAPRLAPAEEARNFINAVRFASSLDLVNVQLIVFEVGPDTLLDRAFAAALLRQAAAPELEAFIREMRVIDLTGRLGAEDYYVLDDHLRASGHDKIAQAIVEEMSRP